MDSINGISSFVMVHRGPAYSGVDPSTETVETREVRCTCPEERRGNGWSVRVCVTCRVRTVK